MKKLFLASVVLAGFSLGGCATTVDKFEEWSLGYQRTVASINANIAATAPLVATSCADLQKLAMLIAPFLQSDPKAVQYFNAANGALNAYCQNIPTDIASTAAAVAAAVAAAQAGYHSVSGA